MSDDELVDDRFWLKRATELVVAASSLRSDAARQLMSSLSWLWTVYTGAAVVRTATAASHFAGGELVVLALPSLLIVVAYAAAMFAYMPVAVEFEPLDPADIRAAYVQGVRTGRQRMRWALVLTGIAALAIGAAIAVSAS